MADVYWYCEDCNTHTMLSRAKHVCNPPPGFYARAAGWSGEIPSRTRVPTRNAPFSGVREEPPPPTPPKKKRAHKAKPAATPKARVTHPPPPNRVGASSSRGRRDLTPQEREALDFVREVATEHLQQVGRSLLGKLISVVSAARVKPDDDDYDFAFEVAINDEDDFFADEEELFFAEQEDLEFAADEDEDEEELEAIKEEWFTSSRKKSFAERLRDAFQD